MTASGVESKRRTETQFEREQSITAFTSILDRLVEATPGALAAAVVDKEGETVDYGGNRIDPYDIKVACAHWRIMLQDLDQGKLTDTAGHPRRVTIWTDERCFVIDVLPEGYALLSLMQRGGAVGHADRALEEAMRALFQEAGWPAPPEEKRWHGVEVRADAAGRPIAITDKRKGLVALAVIGRVVQGLRRGEIGYRVSIDTWASAAPSGDSGLGSSNEGQGEATLVRGLDDRWYSDVPLDEIG